MDRDDVIVLGEIVLVLEGCRVLEVEVRRAGVETCRLLALLELDLLLLLLSDFLLAKAGSINIIRAKTSVAKAILAVFWFFSVAIILLLKYLI